MNCPTCHKEMADDASSCPSCGFSFDDATRRLESNKSPADKPREKEARSLSSFDSIDDARFVPGTMLAERYRIVGLLGKGGMGEVYRADDLKLGQPVALKLLPDHLLSDGAALARFHREVRVARQVSHKNVCRVYDIGEVDGRHFLSMEFIKGEELSSLLHRIGRLPSDKAIQIARQICAGLAAAHDVGVLHRDLKPSNVMIDEHGNARITDFGLAGLAEEFGADELAAGTPAYMAPEQLEGKEQTGRTDIYSLGLVLYELFTGKKAFDAPTLGELIDLRRSDTTPTTPTSIVKDLDPIIEKIIDRCIQKDPAQRPSSALQVAAALPGGDPLAAALAAGETPSPEMVAASGEKTGLRPAIAVACLAAVIAGLIVYALLGSKVNWQAQVLHENSPDALAHKARDIINQLGYTDRPTDSAFGLRYNADYLNDKSVNRWSQFTKSQPASIRFWYRESPRYLEITGLLSGGWVSPEDPPQNVSGMVNLEMDPLGRLLSFTAVPPQVDQSSGALPPPEWTALFAAAGLDPARFTPTEPKWTPLAAFDARAAWTGAYPEQPEIPLRIEAAAYRGKPVYFQLLEPWNKPWRTQVNQPNKEDRVFLVAFCLFLAILLGAVLLARYNILQGRGDRRGAFRLAFFVFAVRMLNWLFGASHVPTFAEVFIFLFLAVSQALLWAGILWLLYIALEPYVRRRWPNTIISWSRVLSGGGLRDPLVGRDVLVGILFGIGFKLLDQLEYLVRLGRGAAPPWGVPLDAWLGARYLIASGFLSGLIVAIVLTLSFFFLMFLLRVVTRRQWLAAGIFVLFWIVFEALRSKSPMIALVFACLGYVAAVINLLRFGLVALACTFFVNFLLSLVPITTDFSAWYAGSTLFTLLAVLVLAGYAFHTSLGGQKVFQGKLLED
ncbi:MAG TPA: serine/threonine-protein kinase [Pyrinomonadaceae bacterium]|nr:serine/threonine-protein kinase [Pyrinomonadaceae bacterium]